MILFHAETQRRGGVERNQVYFSFCLWYDVYFLDFHVLFAVHTIRLNSIHFVIVLVWK